MTGIDGEPCRIRDVVRNSKILRDVPLKPNLMFDSFITEPDRYSEGLRHNGYYDTQLVDGVFPHVGMAEVDGCCYHRSGAVRERNQSWFRSILPTFDGSPIIEEFWEWVDSIEDYFEETQPPERLKCKIASYTLEDEAEVWWDQLQRDRVEEGKLKIYSWARMKRLLAKEFLHYRCSRKVPLEYEGVYVRSDSEKPKQFTAANIISSQRPSSFTDVKQKEHTWDDNYREANEEGNKRVKHRVIDTSVPVKCSTEFPSQSYKPGKDEVVNVESSTPTKCSIKYHVEVNIHKHEIEGLKKQVEDIKGASDIEILDASEVRCNDIGVETLKKATQIATDESECEGPPSEKQHVGYTGIHVTLESDFGNLIPLQQQHLTLIVASDTSTTEEFIEHQYSKDDIDTIVVATTTTVNDVANTLEKSELQSHIISASLYSDYELMAGCWINVNLRGAAGGVKQKLEHIIVYKGDLQPSIGATIPSYSPRSWDRGRIYDENMKKQTKGLDKEIQRSPSVPQTQLELIMGATSGTNISWEQGNFDGFYEHVVWPYLCVVKPICRFVPTSVDAYLTPFVKAYLYGFLSKFKEFHTIRWCLLRNGTYQPLVLMSASSVLQPRTIEQRKLPYRLTGHADLMYSVNFILRNVNEILIEACWIREDHFTLLYHLPMVSIPITLSFDPGGRPCSLETWGVFAFIVYADSFVLNVTIDRKCDERRESGGVTSNIILVFGFLTNGLECDLCNHTVYSMLIAGLTYEGLNLSHDNLSSFVLTRVGFSGVLPCGNLNILVFDEIDHVVAEHGLQPLNVGIIFHVRIPFDPGGIARSSKTWDSDLCAPVLITLQTKTGEHWLAFLDDGFVGVADPTTIGALRAFGNAKDIFIERLLACLFFALFCEVNLLNMVWFAKEQGQRMAAHFVYDVADVYYSYLTSLATMSPKLRSMQHCSTPDAHAFTRKHMINLLVRFPNFIKPRFNVARGPIILWEVWNDDYHPSLEGKFIMSKLSVATISSCLKRLREKRQFKKTLKLFHKMINGLDPPLDVNDKFVKPWCGIIHFDRGRSFGVANWQLPKFSSVAALKLYNALMMHLLF